MNKNAFAGIIAVFLAVSLGANVWLYLKSAKAGKTTKDIAQVALLKDSLQAQILKLDSLQNLLTSTQTDRNNMATKIDELEAGGNATQIADLQNKLAYYQGIVAQSGAALQSATGGGSGKANSSKIAALKADLEEKLKEIEALNAQIATLTSERNAAIAGREEALDGKASLESENNSLKDKIGKGKLPQYSSLICVGMMQKGSTKVESYKAKGLEQFKVKFQVVENAIITEPISEEVTIRILGPDGAVLSKNNNSMQDVDKVYSLKDFITTEGKGEDFTWNYPPSGAIGIKLKKGKYTAELWSRGVLRVRNTFTLN